MKDFTDFENYYNLDCQHLALQTAHDISDSVRDSIEQRFGDVPSDVLAAIAEISANISSSYSMLMLRCYHDWLKNQIDS